MWFSITPHILAGVFLFPQLLLVHILLVDGFEFNTCGAAGSQGPNPHQCESGYKQTDTRVEVLTGNLSGVQVWTVPESTLYSITALGASGGTGAKNPTPTRGAFVHANFNLTKGDKIYILIGQEGESACRKSNPRTGVICKQGIPDSEDERHFQNISGGGGGGGGGTYVFMQHPVTGDFIPLLVAGGGGGLSYRASHGDGNIETGHAGEGLSQEVPHLSYDTPGKNGITKITGPGAGGGWSAVTTLPSAGRSLLEGAVGGRGCLKALQTLAWDTHGGFGGGGGACTAGGGGGGFSGGNVSIANNLEANGQGGSSFINKDLGIEPSYLPATQKGNGVVEVAFVLKCACKFMCIFEDQKNEKYKCLCRPNHILADDGISCIAGNLTGNSPKPDSTWPTGAIIATIVGSIVAILAVSAIIACYIHRRNQKRLNAVRLEMLASPDYQLNRLRQGGGMVTEYNPNYDFGGTKCSLQDLREIPRDDLTLVKALGQGAFGEVYQGYLSNIHRDLTNLPVAVKTLPALCTDQAEMDFLMEALIMSKFNHPNIVRFIGVCFEKHPRFIVLELLDGGDLKTFLREARPKPDSPSRLSMVDLLKLASDVAQGCQYLEENHFIHRDIAARNCLLTTKGADRTAKIADFGMARDIYRADYYRKGGKAMLPVKWMPPEAFLDGVFTSKTDVWSFGILLWEVFSMGYMPYPGRGNQEVMQLVTAGGRLEPPQNCPSAVYHVMNQCWFGIPERRPTFATIIEKLKQCSQDPDVMNATLPVFHRPPSVERDTTIMRPRDADQVVLTVQPPKKCIEPDSPNSTDDLIAPQSPDYNIGEQSKRPNLSASAESLDKLLKEEDALDTRALNNKPFAYNRFNYFPEDQSSQQSEDLSNEASGPSPNRNGEAGNSAASGLGSSLLGYQNPRRQSPESSPANTPDRDIPKTNLLPQPKTGVRNNKSIARSRPTPRKHISEMSPIGPFDKRGHMSSQNSSCNSSLNLTASTDSVNSEQICTDKFAPLTEIKCVDNQSPSSSLPYQNLGPMDNLSNMAARKGQSQSQKLSPERTSPPLQNSYSVPRPWSHDPSSSSSGSSVQILPSLADAAKEQGQSDSGVVMEPRSERKDSSTWL